MNIRREGLRHDRGVFASASSDCESPAKVKVTAITGSSPALVLRQKVFGRTVLNVFTSQITVTAVRDYHITPTSSASIATSTPLRNEAEIGHQHESKYPSVDRPTAQQWRESSGGLETERPIRIAQSSQFSRSAARWIQSASIDGWLFLNVAGGTPDPRGTSRCQKDGQYVIGLIQSDIDPSQLFVHASILAASLIVNIIFASPIVSFSESHLLISIPFCSFACSYSARCRALEILEPMQESRTSCMQTSFLI